MFAEKNVAFIQAWQAMTAQAMRAHQALALSFMRSAWSRPLKGQPAAAQMATQVQAAAMAILGKGMAPLHRKAVANAKRLARTGLR